LAGELVHSSAGATLTQAEFEAVGLHVCNNQATGDLIYASSASQFSRLAIGAADTVLTCDGSVPSWSATPILNNAIGKGTWTASGTWRLPAHQVGGQLDMIAASVSVQDNRSFFLGSANDAKLHWKTHDANAHMIALSLPAGDATNVTVMAFVPSGVYAGDVDLGLFDGITQPSIAIIEKNHKYTFSSTGTHDGIDLDELTETGKFTVSVAGDIIRIISGTNVTAGWYRVKVVTDANNVDLDRDFVTGGAASNVVYVAYHNFGIYASDGPSLPAKYADFSAADFDFDGVIRVGYQLTDHELQIMEPNGVMYKIALTTV